jgi:hypothetical protein
MVLLVLHVMIIVNNVFRVVFVKNVQAVCFYKMVFVGLHVWQDIMIMDQENAFNVILNVRLAQG